MNRTILFSIVFFLSFYIQAQNIPIDFEENGLGAGWDWKVFENGSNPDLEFVPNPDMSGINTSATVAKFTALEVGQPFVGCETKHGAGIGDFVIDESNAIIRIMVWKSVISDVGIKLVRSDNWSLGEIKIPNTVTEEWEQIEFDFSSHIGNPYDQIVIFPDFDNRAEDHVIYFDNVYGAVASPASNEEVETSCASFFPNPVSDIITLTANQDFNHCEIFSVSGQLVGNFNIIDQTIDVHALDRGLYILRTAVNGEIRIERFIKL